MIAFSYSGDPTTSSRDEVRFLIQDTDSTCPLLTDAELDYIIDKWMLLYDSETYCAAIAAGTIARKWAKRINISDGNVSAQVGDLQQRYSDMAKQLKAEYHNEGDVGGMVGLENILANNQFDPTIEPLEFSVGLMDNYLAGKQNYGGRTPDGYSLDRLLGGA